MLWLAASYLDKAVTGPGVVATEEEISKRQKYSSVDDSVYIVQPIAIETLGAFGSSAIVGRCGVVGSTLAFGSIGHGFESEHHLFSHHGVSAFSKLRSLAKCSLDDSVGRLL